MGQSAFLTTLAAASFTIRPNLRDFSGGAGWRGCARGCAWGRGMVPGPQVLARRASQQRQRGDEFRELNLGSGLSAQPSTLGTG